MTDNTPTEAEIAEIAAHYGQIASPDIRGWIDALLRAYRAEKALRESAERVIQWLPIADAPLDGTRVLVAKIEPTPASPGVKARPAHVWFAVSAYFRSDRGRWTDGIGELAPPTHYVPMPKIPEGDQ